MARPLQLALPTPRAWGGRRPGAGRPPDPGRRPRVPHGPRPPHKASHPVHVTFRTVQAVQCLRAARVFAAVRMALGLASRGGFRVHHFTVQENHVHLIVEADDASAFSRGLRGLAIRVARAVNRALHRGGAVWDDRYHARALTTPRTVRNALVYVLMNRHKHRGGETPLDPCSSAAWFDGWRDPVGPLPGSAPVVPAKTWLAAVGWRRHGLVGIEERPRGAADESARGQRFNPGPPGHSWAHFRTPKLGKQTSTVSGFPSSQSVSVVQGKHAAAVPSHCSRRVLAPKCTRTDFWLVGPTVAVALTETRISPQPEHSVSRVGLDGSPGFGPFTHR